MLGLEYFLIINKWLVIKLRGIKYSSTGIQYILSVSVFSLNVIKIHFNKSRTRYFMSIQTSKTTFKSFTHTSVVSTVGRPGWWCLMLSETLKIIIFICHNYLKQNTKKDNNLVVLY